MIESLVSVDAWAKSLVDGLLEFEVLKVGVDIEESIIEVVVWQERVAFVYFQFTE